MKKLILLLLSLLAIGVAVPGYAESNIPERPSTGVYDPDGYLTQKTIDKVVKINSERANTNGAQLAVYIVKTLDGDSIENRGLNIARTWKVGYKDTNRGVVLLLAIEDRDMRIETSDEIAADYITDSQAQTILDDQKDNLRSEDYDLAVNNMIDDIAKATIPMTPEEIKEKKANEAKCAARSRRTFAIAMTTIVGAIIGWFGIEAFLENQREQRKLAEKQRIHEENLKRSQFDYDGPGKLEPNSHDFVSNPSWDSNRLAHFWAAHWLALSQFYYHGPDKVYPDDKHFKANESWTDERIQAYREEKERKRLKELEDKQRRSRYDYEGDDKLYPDHADFISNSTWTAILIQEYLDEKRRERERLRRELERSRNDDHDSGGGWSSGSWSGGGFSGGGASSSW